ncbi:MAG: efflux RND transporter periplasmic adaptor subunit [Pirellulaceae bacterium]|nr:efflux RND transporter periplasmic adaptor subunit [Pirellulaceae bacterium]MDG2103509.1 efflux RND transporter periplasmic adaptor subunit [Pirellulaceae bacterium]
MSIRIACTLFVIISFANLNHAMAQINGFTQPYREIDLASDETGSISTLNVNAGTEVEVGQIIARLDDGVQKLQVEQASHLSHSTSALESAKKTYEKRQLITERIRELISTGHATDSELIRAELEESIAQANYMAAQENTIGHEINLRKAELMLERRLIRAPFAGVVSKVHRRQGEFLSPLKPELVRLVQVDQLLAIFNIPSHQVKSLHQDQPLIVAFHDGTETQGTLHAVGVQTDAESGTVEVKILLDNQAGDMRSGEQCYLDITF